MLQCMRHNTHMHMHVFVCYIACIMIFIATITSEICIEIPVHSNDIIYSCMH